MAVSGERTRPRVQLPAPPPATSLTGKAADSGTKFYLRFTSVKVGGEGAAQNTRGRPFGFRSGQAVRSADQSGSMAIRPACNAMRSIVGR